MCMMQIFKTLQVLIYLFLIPLSLLSSIQRGNVDIPIAEITVSKGFDYAHCFVSGGNPFLFCYDSHTGKAALWNMFGENTPIQTIALGTNWNVFEFVNHENNCDLITLSNGGRVRLTKNILSKSISIAHSFEEDFSDRWSLSKLFPHIDSLYLLSYSKETGTILINTLHHSESFSLRKTNVVQIEPDWDNLQLVENNNNFIVLKQCKKNNRIVVERASKNGQMISENLFNNIFQGADIFELKPTANWTNANLVLANQKVMLFLYCSSNGEVQILLQNDSEKSFTDIYKTKWSKGWSQFEVIYLNGDPHLFHYKESTGLARISKISID